MFNGRYFSRCYFNRRMFERDLHLIGPGAFFALSAIGPLAVGLSLSPMAGTMSAINSQAGAVSAVGFPVVASIPPIAGASAVFGE